MGWWQRPTRYLLGNWGDSSLSAHPGQIKRLYFQISENGARCGWYFHEATVHVPPPALQVVLSSTATTTNFSPKRCTLAGGKEKRAKCKVSQIIKPVPINSLENKKVVSWVWTGHTDGRKNEAADGGGGGKGRGPRPDAGQRRRPDFGLHGAGRRLHVAAFTPS